MSYVKQSTFLEIEVISMQTFYSTIVKKFDRKTRHISIRLAKEKFIKELGQHYLQEKIIVLLRSFLS